MKIIAVGFGIVALAIAVWAVSAAWGSAKPLEIGSFVVLTLTLVVLVWYAYDTNSIARVTRERWERDGVLGATYAMELKGDHGKAPGRTMFAIANPSRLLVTARVNGNFRVYGDRVKSKDLYDGERKWLVFPQQVSTGWFEIESLVQMKGKSVAAMIAERTDANHQSQLTMSLELEFWDELGGHRKLPARPVFFDFVRWAWIPELGESAD